MGNGAIYGLIYGLICDVSIKDDLFVRQLVAADLPKKVVQDQRENHQAPIKVSVLTVVCDPAPFTTCRTEPSSSVRW